jgi:hypothetical protein
MPSHPLDHATLPGRTQKCRFDTISFSESTAGAPLLRLVEISLISQ